MKEVALYIHIPFCKQKCFYCDFPSYAKKDGFMEEYIKALCMELERKCKEYKIRTLFIGGGTPSYLKENSLRELMNCIKKINYTEDAEKTIECNPGTINEEKFLLLKDGGINRLSFGLQTTKDHLLRKIGRIHSYNEFKRNFELARKYDFNNINIDMMFGLPEQKTSEWLESLEEVISLAPEHISAYSLIIEEGTPFFNMYEKNILNLPSEDDEREMYVKGRKLLEKNGYKQYEISNYSIKGKQCEHNKIYWKCDEYLGVGVSSSSYIDNKRIKNIDNIEEYIKRIKGNISVAEEVINNTVKDNIEEFMFMGLRMKEGISEEDFEKRFNNNIDSVYREVIEGNIIKGLLARNNGRIYLTEKGIELSNIVMSDMILE